MTNIDGVWLLLKASEIPVGDNETRVSSIRGKQINFVTKLVPLETKQSTTSSNVTEGTLFDN
jgi:hypothetical protein